jgi:hypothetical protein
MNAYMLGSVWQFTIWVWYLIGGEGTRRWTSSRILLQAKVFLGCCVTKEKVSFPLYTTIGMIDLVERINIPLLGHLALVYVFVVFWKSTMILRTLCFVGFLFACLSYGIYQGCNLSTYF